MLREDVSELLVDVDVLRRKNEKRDEGGGGPVAVVGVLTVAVVGAGDGCCPGLEKLLNIEGEPGMGELGGFSMPMSFMVALRRSRSRRSSSSSRLSSFRAPVTMGGAPAFNVRGRKFAGASGFLSPPNIEKLFQSNDIERRDARVLGAAVGGLEVWGEDAVVEGELNVVRRSCGGKVGVVGAADVVVSEANTDWGRAFFCDGLADGGGDLGIESKVVNCWFWGVVGLAFLSKSTARTCSNPS